MTTLTAVDIGYNAVKGLATNGRQTHFPSVVGKERRTIFSLDEAKRGGLVIQMNDEDSPRWFVGRTAIKESEYSAGRRDSEWIFQEPYRVLLCAALSELHKGAIGTSVVTGLPLEYYTALVDRARSIFIGEHRFRRNGGRWQAATVEAVVIVTQPYGSLLDLALTDNGRILENPFATGMVGIVDIGGVTMNLLTADALEEVGRWTQGDGLGLLKALDSIGRDIKVEYPGFSPQSREVAEWLAAGSFSYQGKSIDIASFAKPHLEPLVQAILDRISEVWDEPGRYAGTLLTGGGAMALGSALKTRMNGIFSNVVIAEDAAFANVRGYLKLARRMWGDK